MSVAKIQKSIRECADVANKIVRGVWQLKRKGSEAFNALGILIQETDRIEANELQRAIQDFNTSDQRGVVFALGRICAIINVLSKKYVDQKNIHRIFLSHSSKDTQLIKAFVEKILRLGCGLQSLDIFCTSIEGMGIKTGEDMRKHMQNELRHCDYVFLMISEDYVKSTMCLNEMGAAWALGKKVKPFLFPNVNYSNIWLSETLQNSCLSHDVILDQLYDELVKEYALTRNTTEWNRQKNDFLTEFNTEPNGN